jgi:hypothetical protein
MASIHEGGCECAKNKLDLFSILATQFDVNTTGEEYLDLANSLLHVRA